MAKLSFIGLGSSPGCFLPGERTKEEEKRIGAHRFLLDGTSPVFRSMFFGPMRETGEMVEVKETTSEAFDLMIKHIYTHQPHYLE